MDKAKINLYRAGMWLLTLTCPVGNLWADHPVSLLSVGIYQSPYFVHKCLTILPTTQQGPLHQNKMIRRKYILWSLYRNIFQINVWSKQRHGQQTSSKSHVLYWSLCNYQCDIRIIRWWFLIYWIFLGQKIITPTLNGLIYKTCQYSLGFHSPCPFLLSLTGFTQSLILFLHLRIFL